MDLPQAPVATGVNTIFVKQPSPSPKNELSHSLSELESMNKSIDLPDPQLPLGLYLSSCKSHFDIGINECETAYGNSPIKGMEDKNPHLCATNTESPDYDIAPPLSDLEEHISQRYEFPNLTKEKICIKPDLLLSESTGEGGKGSEKGEMGSLFTLSPYPLSLELKS